MKGGARWRPFACAIGCRERTPNAASRGPDAINFALLSPLNLVFAGFTFVLYGLAAALSQVYPRWLGWIAVTGGAGGAVSGVVQAYVGEPSGLTEALGIAAPTVITLWLLVMGILFLRRGSVVEIGSGPTRPEQGNA